MVRQALSVSNSTLILFLLFCGCSAKTELVSKPVAKIVLASDKNLAKVDDMAYYAGKPYTGVVYSMYNKKDTAFRFSYLDGREQGCQKKWYANGQLAEERYFSFGRKNGIQHGWWPNGNQQFSFTAENDKHEGSYREWMEDGRLIRSFNYVNGQEEGSQQLYNEDGSLRSNYVIRSGRRFGLLGTKNCVNVKDSVIAY
jgi:antitoxin component YwqK of YwqJK toxin-antitoxin module